jgi:hypothetical protein
MTTPDRRPGRAAASLGISREVARGLLAINRDTRRDLLAELTRVAPSAALVWLRFQATASAN